MYVMVVGLTPLVSVTVMMVCSLVKTVQVSFEFTFDLKKVCRCSSHSSVYSMSDCAFLLSYCFKQWLIFMPGGLGKSCLYFCYLCNNFSPWPLV